MPNHFFEVDEDEEEEDLDQQLQELELIHDDDLGTDGEEDDFGPEGASSSTALFSNFRDGHLLNESGCHQKEKKKKRRKEKKRKEKGPVNDDVNGYIFRDILFFKESICIGLRCNR